MNPYDLWIFKDGDLVGVVIINNRKHLVKEEAVKLYQTIFAEKNPSKYVLLVSQDFGYLWRPAYTSVAEPAAEFSMREIVVRYLPDHDPDTRLRGFGLNMIVLQWLYNLSSITDRNELVYEEEKRFAEIGFLSSIYAAVISREVGS